jgi:transposase
MRTLTIGLDIAKNVFQVHGVDRSGKTVHSASSAEPTY